MSKQQTAFATHFRPGTSRSDGHHCNPLCGTRAHKKDPQRQTPMPKVRPGASPGGTHQKHMPSLQAPAGGFSCEAPWRISRNPGKQGMKHGPLISCFELLTQLALLVCRLRSPLPTSGRILLRQGADNVTASAANHERLHDGTSATAF